MTYQVTARKWRPMVFDDVIGQSHVSDTLRNALSQNRLAHAFIFSGTRGCGKTTTARILARAVNCLTPKNFEPCNVCDICREIIDGRSLDVIEIDGASNRGVEEIRNLRESVRYAPTRGKKKVYIIDEVHMLTKEAFNALLKTLEEPPPHVMFIFATTELHKVPATILSRCQRYDFRRISVDEIVGRLRFIAGEEKIVIDDDALLIIAKKGDGSMRDAQSIFDQVISFCGTTVDAKQVGDALNIVDQELFFRVSDILRTKETTAALDLVKEVINSGFDVKEFVSGLAEHFRNFLIVKTTGATTLIEESEFHRKRYAADAASFSLNDILRIVKTASETEQSIRYAPQPRFKLEVMMVQLTKMDSSVKIDDLLTQIDDLKKKLLAEPVQPSRRVSSPVEHSAPETLPVPTAVYDTPAPAVIDTPKPKVQIPDSQPRYTFVAPAKPASESVPVSVAEPAAAAVSVTLADVRSEWNTIIDAMRKKKISVGTILGETSPVDIVNGSLHIACGDDFHRGTLFRNKEILAETINTILRSRLRIEPILQEAGSSPQRRDSAAPAASTSSSSVSPEKPATHNETSVEHPLVKKLYSDFGAERV